MDGNTFIFDIFLTLLSENLRICVVQSGWNSMGTFHFDLIYFSKFYFQFYLATCMHTITYDYNRYYILFVTHFLIDVSVTKVKLNYKLFWKFCM